MLINFAQEISIISQYIRELRDTEIQKNRAQFRENVRRIGSLLAYEVSKKLHFKSDPVQTPLGVAPAQVLVEQPVVGTILRAGLPLHEGIMQVFDRADTAFVSAFRKYQTDQSFEIVIEYHAHPILKDRILILADTMLATGQSLCGTIEKLSADGAPREIHIVVVIASQAGVDYVLQRYPHATIWAAAVDPEINAHSYIVPGLGDAGDLSYGSKQ